MATAQLSHEAVAVRSPWRTSRTRGQALWGYLLIAPMMIGFAIFFLVALVASLVLSMTDWDVLSAPQWVGLSNYARLPQDAEFLAALRNTAVLTIPNVALRLILSLLHRAGPQLAHPLSRLLPHPLLHAGADDAGGDRHDLEVAVRSQLRADQCSRWAGSGCRSRSG